MGKKLRAYSQLGFGDQPRFELRHDPCGSNQKKQEVLKERWVFTLDFMAPELTDPRQDKEKNVCFQEMLKRGKNVAGAKRN